MKNSSGAIGAAKAPPYLVSHRRIINVIRIMYPRNSPIGRGSPGLRRKEGSARGKRESRRERRVFMLWDILRRYPPNLWEEGRGNEKGRGTMRVQRERRRCPHDRSPRQGRTLSLLNPGAAIPDGTMPSPRILHSSLFGVAYTPERKFDTANTASTSNFALRTIR